MTSVIPLFSYPVMVCSENYQFTEAEEKYISDLAMAENVGNLMSSNDTILDSVELSKLKAFIDSQIYVYKKNILKMRDDNEIYITQSWANKAKKDDFHPHHKHPNSMLSGVLFVTGNEGEEMPPIRFHRTNDLLPLEVEFEEYNEFNNGIRWIGMEKGKLVVFPSVLIHDVGKNETNVERVTLSFNTFVSGTIGGKAQLSEVAIPIA